MLPWAVPMVCEAARPSRERIIMQRPMAMHPAIAAADTERSRGSTTRLQRGARQRARRAMQAHTSRLDSAKEGCVGPWCIGVTARKAERRVCASGKLKRDDRISTIQYRARCIRTEAQHKGPRHIKPRKSARATQG